MNSDQAQACCPRFARVKPFAKGTRTTFEPLKMSTIYDPRWPNSAPVDSTERVIARYGGEFMGGGPLDSEDNPFTKSVATSSALREFFHVDGSITLTHARLLGSGVRGTSLLGAIDLRSGGQLLFSLDLDEIFSVTVLEPPTHPIHLDMANQLSIARLWVSVGAKGSLTGKTAVSKRDVAARIVQAACARRLLDGSLDAVERRRVEGVAAGQWTTEKTNLVAHIRHPDDLSDWVTGDLNELPDPLPPQAASATRGILDGVGERTIVAPSEHSETAATPLGVPPQATVVPPAGWYDAPGETGQYRYWDGSAWTNHRAPK